jgi:hypothetical protein
VKPDPAKNLAAHMGRILGKECSRGDLVQIMRFGRLIIEQDNSSNAYAILWLYCHWMLHNKIDRQRGGWDILEKINDVLVTHGSGDMTILGVEISKAISLDKLRREIGTLFVAKSVPTDLVDSLANWKAFTGAILDELCLQPIRLPEDVETNPKAPGRAVFDRMVAKRTAANAPRPDAVPRAFYISNRLNEPAEAGRPPGFYWNLRLLEQNPYHAEVNGFLYFTEGPNNFKRP